MARPPSERARRDALEAAHELLLERGLEGFTIEEVAARSGVAKSTIYRRWASTHELLVASLHELVDTFPTPNTGNLRDDLIAMYHYGIPLFATPGMRSIILGMMSAAEGDPEIGALHDKLHEEREHPLTILLQLAIGRGELPADLNLELAEDLIDGPVFRRIMVQGGEFTDAEIEQLVDWTIAALSAPLGATSIKDAAAG